MTPDCPGKAGRRVNRGNSRVLKDCLCVERGKHDETGCWAPHHAFIGLRGLRSLEAASQERIVIPKMAEQTARYGPFQHVNLKHRVIAWISTYLLGGVTYTVRKGLLKGMRRKGGLGWWPISSRETPEHTFLRTIDLSNATVYDVEAFHGVLTLFFARQAVTVVCYERNSRNRKHLNQNILLNRLKNVIVRPLGLDSERKSCEMNVDLLARGTAAIDRRDGSTETVALTTLDQDIQENGLPAPTFIRIDVEGREIEVLKGMKRTLMVHRPDLFIELHGETMTERFIKSNEIVRFVLDLDYRIKHIESGESVSRATRSVAQGHLYCRAV